MSHSCKQNKARFRKLLKCEEMFFEAKSSNEKSLLGFLQNDTARCDTLSLPLKLSIDWSKLNCMQVKQKYLSVQSILLVWLRNFAEILIFFRISIFSFRNGSVEQPSIFKSFFCVRTNKLQQFCKDKKCFYINSQNLRKVTIYLLTSCNTEERIAQNIYIRNSNRNYKKINCNNNIYQETDRHRL